jgi:hypothetical protein
MSDHAPALIAFGDSDYVAAMGAAAMALNGRRFGPLKIIDGDRRRFGPRTPRPPLDLKIIGKENS